MHIQQPMRITIHQNQYNIALQQRIFNGMIVFGINLTSWWPLQSRQPTSATSTIINHHQKMRGNRQLIQLELLMIKSKIRNAESRVFFIHTRTQNPSKSMKIMRVITPAYPRAPWFFWLPSPSVAKLRRGPPAPAAGCRPWSSATGPAPAATATTRHRPKATWERTRFSKQNGAKDGDLMGHG